MWRKIRGWLIARGLYWTRCPTCKRLSNHHHLVREGREIKVYCNSKECWPKVARTLYGDF